MAESLSLRGEIIFLGAFVADNSKFVPPKGMRDWLPQETLLRQKLIRLIESHYQLYGFQPIDTPVMENIEVLQGKGGGENEKLMFKVMKRGEEAEGYMTKFLETQTDLKARGLGIRNFTSGIADMGLRFDMTVPLARYYGNHANDLSKPFRCYHIGPVWRADKPQRGRFREFYQCDIDVIGSASENCEVELLLATDRVLKALNIGKFKIRVSDKRILPTWLSSLGGDASSISNATIAIDKRDKQSLEAVTQQICTSGLPINAVNILNNQLLSENLYFTDSSFPTNLADVSKDIAAKVKEINPDANVVFDPWLVRGFDYYTGSVFEINVEDKDFTFSIGGGGRYDGLIEKLGGPKGTTAVGISLGFERILTILMEKEGGISKTLQQRVYIVNDGKSEKDIQVLAETLRSQGIAVETGLEKKDKVKQLVAAQENGLEYAITDFVLGSGTFKVRQLSNRQDTEMTAEQLKAALQKLL